MSRIESRIKEFTTRLSQWWSSSSKTARQRRTERTADLRREATARAQQAASKVQDFRDSDRGQRAAAKVSDLRASETAKRAEAALHDLRASDVGQKAEGALTDLRQRESVKKAEESARKALHDLFSGTPGSSKDATGDH